MLLDPATLALALTALALGVSGVVALLAGGTRRLAPASVAFLMSFGFLVTAGVIMDASPGWQLRGWGEALAMAGAGGVALGALFAATAFALQARRQKQLSTEASGAVAEAERLLGINVRIEDELNELRGELERNGRDRNGAASARSAALMRQQEALERAEANWRKHRAVFEQALDGMAVLDPGSLRVVEVNHGLCRMTARDEDELVGKALTELFLHGEDEVDHADLLAAAREGKPQSVVLPRKDGGLTHAEVSVSVIGAGDDEQLLAVLRDVGSRRNLEAELQRHVNAVRERERTLKEVNRELGERTQRMEQMNFRLHQLQETKDHFLSSVSHELRTPLTSIRSFSEILLKHGDADPTIRREFLEIINKESERLTRLVNNVLDLARIEAGELRLVLSEFDAVAAVNDAIASVSGVAAERGITLEPDWTDELRPLYADRDKIQQLVTNLLGNAVKFSPDGEKVEIVIHPQPTEGHVRLGVRDHGVGIHPDELKSVFDKFRQVGDSDAKSKGSGLGLTITREIAHAHGGRIWADSEPGAGATFWVELPTAEESKRIFAARGAGGMTTSEPISMHISQPVNVATPPSPGPTTAPVLVEEVLTGPAPGAEPDTGEIGTLPPLRG